MDNPFAIGYVEPEQVDAPVYETAAPKIGSGRVVYHNDVQQGSEEWHACRLGLMTASELKLVITPGLKLADNKDCRIHLYELLAQRVNRYVEPHFQSHDMERGNFDEGHAREKYSETYAPVVECGFITNDKWGFTLGYSPDGLVGDDGLIECKSRVQKHQMKTLIENVAKDEIPDDFVIQVQSALLISERKWCDFISYSGGMPMAAVRVYPDPVIQEAIVTAATAFEARLTEAREIYDNLIASDARLIPTERLLQL